MVTGRAVKKGPVRAWLQKIFGKTPGNIVFNVLLYLFFIAFSAITLYPFLFVVLESMKSVIPGTAGNPQYVYNLSAYIYVFTGVDGLVWSFVWSLIVALAATVLHVFCCMLTAYPLTKKSLKGRTGILLFILFTMLFSGGLPFIC